MVFSGLLIWLLNYQMGWKRKKKFCHGSERRLNQVLLLTQVGCFIWCLTLWTPDYGLASVASRRCHHSNYNHKATTTFPLFRHGDSTDNERAPWGIQLFHLSMIHLSTLWPVQIMEPAIPSTQAATAWEGFSINVPSLFQLDLSSKTTPIHSIQKGKFGIFVLKKRKVKVSVTKSEHITWPLWGLGNLMAQL